MDAKRKPPAQQSGGSAASIESLGTKVTRHPAVPDAFPAEILFKVADSELELEHSQSLIDSRMRLPRLETEGTGSIFPWDHGAYAFSTCTLVVRFNTQVIAVASLVPANRSGLPLTGVYSVPLGERALEKSVELSDFVLDPEYANYSEMIMVGLMKLVILFVRDKLEMEHLLCAFDEDQAHLAKTLLPAKEMQSSLSAWGHHTRYENKRALHVDLRDLPERMALLQGRYPWLGHVRRFIFEQKQSQVSLPQYRFFSDLRPQMEARTGITSRWSDHTPPPIDRDRRADRTRTLTRAFGQAQQHYQSPSRVQYPPRQPRLKVALQGKIVTCEGKLIAQVEVLDVSRNGVKIQSSEPIESKEQLGFEMQVGDNFRTHLTVRLVWRSAAVHGLEVRRADGTWISLINYLFTQVV